MMAVEFRNAISADMGLQTSTMVKNIKSASTQEDPFRDEFHRLLGRLIHSIARFDFTVGLQLNWLGPHCQQDVSGLLSARQAKLGERLKKLKTLIMDVYEPAGPVALAEFSVWFDKADQARVLRNDYAHGRWGVPGKYRFKPPGRMIDAEPLLAFIPLHWDMTPDRADDSIYMTLDEFAGGTTGGRAGTRYLGVKPPIRQTESFHGPSPRSSVTRTRSQSRVNWSL